MRHSTAFALLTALLFAHGAPAYANPHGGSAPSFHGSAPAPSFHQAPAPSFHQAPAPSFHQPTVPAFQQAPAQFTPSRPIQPSHFTPSAPAAPRTYNAPRVSPAQSVRAAPTGRPGAAYVHNAPVMAPRSAMRPQMGPSPVRRTEMRGGNTFVRTYRPYTWGGRPYYAYQPAYAYPGWYYGYCGRLWYTPVSYQWGWMGSPWYASYGYYYSPYPTYAGPAFWLTDFVIADLLAEQYAENVAAANANAAAQANAAAAQADAQASAPISDEVKEQIRLQVQADIKAQQEQRPVTVDTVVADTQHIFAVSEQLNVANASTQQPCALTEGDLIRLKQPVADGAPTGLATVVASKKASCIVGTDVNVSVHDLQTFENEFSARVDKGMQEMKTKMPDGTHPAQ